MTAGGTRRFREEFAGYRLCAELTRPDSMQVTLTGTQMAVGATADKPPTPQTIFQTEVPIPTSPFPADGSTALIMQSNPPAAQGLAAALKATGAPIDSRRGRAFFTFDDYTSDFVNMAMVKASGRRPPAVIEDVDLLADLNTWVHNKQTMELRSSAIAFRYFAKGQGAAVPAALDDPLEDLRRAALSFLEQGLEIPAEAREGNPLHDVLRVFRRNPNASMDEVLLAGTAATKDPSPEL
jgi:hypothetical protein